MSPASIQVVSEQPRRCELSAGEAGVEIDHPSARMTSGRSLAAVDGSSLRRAAAVSAVVGTMLTFVNHGAQLLHLPPTRALLSKVLFTYAVPFVVSVYSSVAASRADRRSHRL
jgi:hypothetical protein